jgi:WG repeat protein/FAD binding domain-containing protein
MPIHPSRIASSLRLIVMLALSISAPAVHAQKIVSQIEIHSGWGGLGTPQNANVIIQRKNGVYLRDGKPVFTAQVEALVAALEAPRIPEPEMKNLGVTPEWLKAQVTSQRPKGSTQTFDTTANQRELFTATFTNPELVAKVIPNLFEYTRFDDYPFAKVKVDFDDGSKLTAESNSYYVYMVPWTLNGSKDESYNAEISRALSALLPSKAPNKERLSGDDFLTQLVDAVMNSIGAKWKLLGVESRAADALAALRNKFTVESADINPYHDVAFGIQWSAKEPPETNLHATLHKPTFPANFFEDLILLYDHDKVQGVDEFLKTGAIYEDLALSIPWLNDYIRAHPQESVFLMHVHQTSFGDHAMNSFALDMKARGREDLIPAVRTQQAQIALLKIGFVYWLVFPDKHMMLWRFEGPRGFLKWKQSDFPAGRCGDYQVNNGGCSGREISPDGTLIADHAPRDQECMSAYRATHVAPAQKTDVLFPVTERDRGGYIDQTGAMRIPLCFDSVSDFSEGLARFERDGLWGYLDTTGAVVIEPKFPWAEMFSEGLARVQVTGTSLGYDGRWGFIDRTGKVVVDPVYMDRGEDEPGEAFHDGLAKIEVEEKVGYIDKTGKVVIEPRFTYASPFSEGVAAVTESSLGDDGWGFINKTGNWVIPPKFEWAGSFTEHLAAVNRTQHCAYIDPTGAYALQPPVSPGEKDCATVWGDFIEGLSRWKFGNKYGYIDRSGKVVIKKYKIQTPPFYAAWATPVIHDTRAGLRINAKCQVVDFHGNIIPGLYCGGESAGGFSLHGMARCIVQGRIAGRNAAAS